jgi:integrase
MVIRIRGVKAVRSKGRLYYYHRKTMTRLPGEPGTTVFMDRLRELEAGLAKPKNPLPGALGALIRDYRRSPEFASLADRTRADYLRVFDYLKPLDGMPIAAIDGRFLYGVRDKAAAAKKRRFANYVIQVLRLVFNWGMRRALCERNPAVAVDLIRRPRNAPVVNRPWKLEELDVVLDAAPAELRIAIAIGAYVGLREGDMLRVTWACYDGSAFEVRQHKTGGSVWVKAHSRLCEILDTASPEPNHSGRRTRSPFHAKRVSAAFLRAGANAGHRREGCTRPIIPRSASHPRNSASGSRVR